MPWEFRGDLPIYTQLIDHVRRQLVSGQRQPGERLPSVRDLAAEAGVNPNTMQRALAELERQGLVRSHRTAGRFVTEDREALEDLRTGLAREQIRAFLENMAQLGYHLPEIIALLEKEGEKET